MKPVTQITDRAKRLRANKVHKLRKRCQECGAKRNLGVGHRDGDESNNRPSNLFTQCKSCNGKQAARDKRLGRGVRTRQYNPRLSYKCPHCGAVISAQTHKVWNHKIYKHFQECPKMPRKNPGAINLAQYVQAAVDHTRGAHDEGGRVLHETPKSKRKEFAREIAWRKGYRNNPSEADTLYKKFHGRGPDRIYDMQVAGVDPYGGHPELTSLGPLIRFIVGEDVVLGGQYGDEVKEADWVREISFVPSVARWHEWLERTDPPVQEAKARLREWKAPDLAAVPNSKHLYILGRQTVADSILTSLGSDPEKDVLDLGFVYLIEYFTQKRFDRFEPINYFHHFGEKTGVTPRLIYDRSNKLLSLAGGEYKVTPRGIEN